MRKHIPNLFTLGNMLCGMVAIFIFISDFSQWEIGVYLIGISALLDFFDGFVARLLGVAGDLGKQLDSLADVVSFGVAPAFGLASSVGLGVYVGNSGYSTILLPAFSLLIALFSALRLAKFNIDTRQTEKFIGLPTPANTIAVLSLAWGLQSGEINLLELGAMGTAVYIGLVLLSSYLLVSEITLISLKFKTFGWSGNQSRWLLIAGSIAIFGATGVTGLSLVVLLYLLISIIDNRIHRHEVSR